MKNLSNRTAARLHLVPTIALLLSSMYGGVCLAAQGSSVAGTTSDRPWMQKGLSPERRAELLVSAMTLAQKEQQLVGSSASIVAELPSCYGARHVNGIAELQIPTLRITNGPVGIGQNDCVSAELAKNPSDMARAYTDDSSAKATALPSAITMAASFDPQVAEEFGHVIGDEANALALHVFEAPGLNLARLPILGRNFEYFGEDPYLTGVMGVAEIRAVQAKGVIAMAKHFAANEQETNRNTLDARVDEQTLRELYLLPFEMAVKDAQVASIMCSYNYVNGKQACENNELLTGVLRKEWGFKGYVQSDFFATKSTVPTLLGGLDHMMPLAQQWSVPLLTKALNAGQLSESDIDTALKRRYTQMFKLGIFGRKLVQKPIDYKSGGQTARELGHRGAVLLQNDNKVLPFPSTVRSVVVIGKASQVYAQQAVAGGAIVGKAMGGGGGSSDVVPPYTVTPAAGIRDVLQTQGNSSVTVKLVLVDDANQSASIDGTQATYDDALGEVKSADAVVVMAGTIAEEGADRAAFTSGVGLTMNGTLAEIGDGLDWYVPNPSRNAVPKTNKAQNSNTVKLIQDILAVSSTTAKPTLQKVALVLKDNAGVALDPTLVGTAGPAILETWFPGQEDGHIVADLLFGVVNPSGKLPVTFPFIGRGFLNKIGSKEFPGEVDSVTGLPTVRYSERLNIGYRWYDTNNVVPAFAFGHGLSYTTFTLDNPRVKLQKSQYVVNVNVKNTGKLRGSEVVQVYASIPAAGQPKKRLIGFKKIALDPAAQRGVSIVVDPASTNHPLSVWDEQEKKFVIPHGKFEIYVGNSSDKLQIAGSFTR